MRDGLRRLEINGGRVSENETWRLELPAGRNGYADAQVDDYGGRARADYPWRPRVRLSAAARFSHENDELEGTAGFGFWNAPFGDPTIGLPSLPQATWFFYASAPSDLPLPLAGPGRGWFVSTLDATRSRAKLLAPLAPVVVALNNVASLRRWLWPWVRERLAISHAPLEIKMKEWHRYELTWDRTGCGFNVDGRRVFETKHAPTGPLGFVAWIDNQYLVARPTGRLQWGTLAVRERQCLEMCDLRLEQH